MQVGSKRKRGARRSGLPALNCVRIAAKSRDPYGGRALLGGFGLGRDHTLFATATGQVKFLTKRDNRTYVSVMPVTAKAEAAE